MLLRLLALAAVIALPAPAVAQTTFFDLNSAANVYGTAAVLAGTLGGNAVTITITANSPTAANQFRLNAPTFGSNWGASTDDGTSVQYNHPEIYAASAANIDRVGFSKPVNNALTAADTATVTITFATPIAPGRLNINVANLDQARFDFSKTANLTGLTVLKGNGGADNDGLGVSGKTLVDLSPDTRNTGTTQDATYVGLLPTNGTARSAYGTVRFDSATAISSLTFDINSLSTTTGTDSGSFTLSLTPVPEPGLPLAACAAGLVGWRLRRRATGA